MAHHAAINNQASAIANYDYGVGEGDEDEEIKYETVTHECAQAVQAARINKKWTQEQLAKAINEKAGLIHDIENGSARYVPD